VKGLKNFNNMELSAILLNEGKLADELRNLGIPVVVVDETRMNFFQIVRNVQRIIMKVSPDIIHSHRMKENILSYLSAKSDNRIQLVCTQHGMPEPIRFKYKIMKHIFLSKYNNYIIRKYFRYVISVSEDIRNILIQKCSFQSSKVILIYNGTEIQDNNSLDRDRDIFVIGSAGRFFPIKDYPLLVEIAREVLHQTDKVKFELAGEGPEKEMILSLIRGYGIEKAFSLTGFIDDMAIFYEGLDLYINTSIHEGLPMSILEAMAHGLPVIAPNTGGIKEILQNGIEGYLVEGRNPKMFAEKCIQLARDKKLSRTLGKASREKIMNDFSLDKMARNYYDLYSRVIEQN
jgi:glycosyltransferase involved in cell wall biosynthesis